MGGNYVGLPGGSTSIGLIGTAPDMMKPLSYGKNPTDKIIYPFLFRGLIRYNPEDDTARWDLAQCDISDIEKVTCTLKKDIFWSDNTAIQADDVIASFRAFTSSGEYLEMAETLRDTRIEAKENSITFFNPDKDPNILKLLTYPIYRSDMIEQIRTWRFSTGSYVTSGQYTFSEAVTDTTYIHDRITLVANPNTSEQKAWFDKIHFKFFENVAAMKNAEDTIGIIIPPANNEKLSLSERFRPYNYTTYEYFSVFFQTDRLSKSLRNSFHWQLATSFSGQTDAAHKAIENIFPGRWAILPRGNIGNFPDIMKSNGYMKRDDWINSIDSTPVTITGSIVYDAPKYFINKQKSNVLFYDNADGGILLSGEFDAKVSSVIINWYTLQEFRPGNQKFSYRISLENETLIEGKNTYLLEGKVGETDEVLSEILTLYYTPDTEKMAEYKKIVDDEYIARMNTPALIAEREREKTKQKESAIALDPLYYYNKEGKEFQLVVAYITGLQSTETYALAIEKILKNLSIKAELKPLDPKMLQEIIKTGEKDYDILIAWVSAGDSLAGIGQLFDPKSAGKWVNFANIEIPKLVTLFWELRAATLPEKIESITTQILTVMEEESFFFPISSPIHTLYLDRNLKWIRTIPVIAGTNSLYDIVEFASIRDEYVFNTEGKWFTGFFSWFAGLLF